MSAKEIWRQFLRLILAGSIATLVAILAERKLGSWWAGAGFGVPIAILIADVKKTRVAAVDFWDCVMPEIAPVLLVAVPFCATFVVVTYGAAAIFPFATLKGALGDIGAIMIGAAVLFIVAAFVRAHVERYQRKAAYDKRPFAYLPLTRLFACWRAMRERGAKPVGLLEFLGHVHSRRDERGDIIRADRLEELFALGLYAASLPIQAWLLAVFGVLGILIDTLMTCLMKLMSTESVSVAAGAVIGFSIDYFFGPERLQGALATTMWLSGCSLLGGALGSVLWYLKRSLELWEPSIALEARKPHTA